MAKFGENRFKDKGIKDVFGSNPNMALQYNRDTDFSIEHSFLLDGVDEKITIPNAALVNTLSGSNKKFSIFLVVKRASTGGEQNLLSSFGSPVSMMTRFEASGSFNMLLRDAGNAQLRTSNLFNNTSIWYAITFSYDSSLSLGSRGSIMVNGVDEAISVDQLTTTVDTTTDVYNIGSRSSSSFFNGNVAYVGVRNNATTIAEHITWLNEGNPLDIRDQFGSEGVYLMNPDDSGSTAQFSIVDSVNNVTATSVNLEDVDKTTDTPYT